MQMLSLCESQAVLPARRLLHAALRIRKNMKSKSQRPAEEDVWGGPAVLLAPGQARPTRARIFSQRSRENTNLIDHARPAGRPVGSACGFLSRSDAGQIALEPTANGTWRETSLNHRHFVDAHPYRMRLHTQGGFCAGARGKPAVCRSACQRGVQAARESSSHVRPAAVSPPSHESTAQ